MRRARRAAAAVPIACLLLLAGCTAGPPGAAGPSSGPSGPGGHVGKVGPVDPATVQLQLDTWSYWLPGGALLARLVDGVLYVPLPIPPDPGQPRPCVARTVPADVIRGWVERLDDAGVGTRTDWGTPGITDASYLRVLVDDGHRRRSAQIYALGATYPGVGLGPEELAARSAVQDVLAEMTARTADSRTAAPTVPSPTAPTSALPSSSVRAGCGMAGPPPGGATLS